MVRKRNKIRRLPHDQILLCDNLDLLSQLPDQCVDLVHVDGPYNTGKDWGDFIDKFDSMDSYIDFMGRRFRECRRVMKDAASIYVHCDYHASHYLKVELDLIFGRQNLINEVIWDRNNKGGFRSRNRFIRCHETIFLYAKGKKYTFNMQYDVLNDEAIARKFPRDDNNGKGRYRWVQMSFKKMPKDLKQGLAEGYYKWPKSSKQPYYKKYITNYRGNPQGSVIKGFSSTVSRKKQKYATEKPEGLIELLIRSSTNAGDLVLELFLGSAPACVVAKRLGRKYIGCDINPRAVKFATNRLKHIDA